MGPGRWSAARRRAGAAALVAVAALSACSVKHKGSGGGGDTQAADSKVSFSGKTITIITNATAGGSSDVIARLIAAKLPDYLPGKPTVIVKNVTGGGGSVEINQVAATEPANGLTIGEFNSGMAIRYLTKQPGFDAMAGLPIVAGLPQGAVAVYNKNVGTDAKAIIAKGKTLRIGQTSAGGTGAMLSIVAADLLKLPNKQVYGFSGGSAETTSMQRGELDGTVTADLSYQSTFAPDVKSGRYVALFQAGFASGGTIVKSPLVSSSIPTVLDLYKQLNNGATPSGPAWQAYQLMATLQAAYTTFGVRKGTPANIATALSDGFAKMAASADWKSFTQSKLGAAAVAAPLATIQQEWNAALNSTPEQVELLKKYSGLQSS
jgi:tripartite-type tricarboxylate transporter receptor subunit TctC